MKNNTHIDQLLWKAPIATQMPHGSTGLRAVDPDISPWSGSEPKNKMEQAMVTTRPEMNDKSTHMKNIKAWCTEACKLRYAY